MWKFIGEKIKSTNWSYRIVWPSGCERLRESESGSWLALKAKIICEYIFLNELWYLWDNVRESSLWTEEIDRRSKWIVAW